MNNISIKYGVIGGVALVVYSIILYITNLFANMTMGLLTFVIIIAILVVAARKTKQSLEGIISFKDAFVAVFTTAVVMTIISTIFQIILFNFVDTGLALEIEAQSIENTVELLEKFNSPDEAIDEAVHSIEESFAEKFTIIGQLKGMLIALVIYVFASMIIALIIKTPGNNEPIPNPAVLD